MSVPVELPALRSRLAEFGDRAFLMSVTDEETPHVVSVVVRLDGDRLVTSVGRRTRANAEARPTITLLWPAPSGAPYCLIVDGTFAGETPAGDIAVEPTSAVLHRVAGTPGDGPNCIPVTES